MDISHLVGALVALFGVLLLAVVIVRGLRRVLPDRMAARTGGRGRLNCLSSMAIDPRRRVLLAACDGREFLLLIAPEGSVMIGWLDGREERPAGSGGSVPRDA